MSLMGISFLYEFDYYVTSLCWHCISIIFLTFLGRTQQALGSSNGGVQENCENTLGSSHVSTNHYHSLPQAYLLYLNHESFLQYILRQLELSN